MSEPDLVTFPVYLMRGEMIELGGNYYVIPEPVACDTQKDLVSFLYEKGLTTENSSATEA